MPKFHMGFMHKRNYLRLKNLSFQSYGTTPWLRRCNHSTDAPALTIFEKDFLREKKILPHAEPPSMKDVDLLYDFFYQRYIFFKKKSCNFKMMSLELIWIKKSISTYVIFVSVISSRYWLELVLVQNLEFLIIEGFTSFFANWILLIDNTFYKYINIH